MGYLCLVFALAAGVIKGFSCKKVSRDVHSLKDGLFVNLLRTAICSLFGLAFLLVKGDTFALTAQGAVVCAVSAVGVAVFSISWLYAYQSEAYMFLSVFTMLGSIVTGIFGVLFLQETLSVPRMIGMVLLVAAVYVMSIYNANVTGKITLRGWVTLIVGALGSSIADFMQKLHVGSAFTFSFYTYFLALIPQLILWLCVAKVGQQRTGLLSSRKHLTVYVVISLCLFLNSLTKAIAAKYLPASLMYPLLQGANLIVSAVLARVLLKEKITAKSAMGISLALCAIATMNI